MIKKDKARNLFLNLFPKKLFIFLICYSLTTAPMNPVAVFRIVSTLRAVAPVASRVLFAANAINMAKNMGHAINNPLIRREMLQKAAINKATNTAIGKVIEKTIPDKKTSPPGMQESLYGKHAVHVPTASDNIRAMEKLLRGADVGKAPFGPVADESFEGGVSGASGSTGSNAGYYGMPTPSQSDVSSEKYSPTEHISSEDQLRRQASDRFHRRAQAHLNRLTNEARIEKFLCEHSPEYARHYEEKLLKIANTLIASNSMQATIEDRIVNRLALTKLDGLMRGFLGADLNALLNKLYLLFFESEGAAQGALKPPVISHRASELILDFCKEYLPEKVWKESLIETNLANAKTLLQEGFLTRLGKSIANIPHRFKHNFTGKFLRSAVIENKTNAAVPQLIELCEQGNFEEAQQLLQNYHNDSALQRLFVERRAAYYKIYNEYHVPRMFERDPLWQALAEQNKKLLLHDPTVRTQLVEELTARAVIKKAIEDQLQLDEKTALLLEPLNYTLVHFFADPMVQYSTIEAFIKDRPIIEGIDVAACYFDNRGILKLLAADPYVDSLVWPTSDAYQRSLINSLLIKKLIGEDAATLCMIDNAITDMHNSLISPSSTEGSLARAILNAGEKEGTGQALRLLGNMYEALPTQEQQHVQAAVRTICTKGLSLFEKASPEFIFDATHASLFQDFIQRIESVRALNSAGNVDGASALLSELSALFNKVAHDSPLPEQIAAYKTFFSPHGVCKLFDEVALPCSFSSDLGCAHNVDVRNFVTTCLGAKAAGIDQALVDRCLIFSDYAVAHPEFKQEYMSCGQFMLGAITSPDFAASFPQSMRALQDINVEHMNITGGNSAQVALQQDALRLLGSGISQYAATKSDASLADLVQAVGDALSNSRLGNPSNGVPGLFTHAKSLGFPLQSSLPVRLWIKTHPKQIAAAAVAGVAGSQIWKQYGKRYMQPSTSTERPRIVPQEPEGEAQARSSSEPAAAAAGGAPMPPEDPEDPPSDSDSDADDELRDNESDSDEEDDCPASCPNQFDRLNDALKKEQYTSIIGCTKHGLKRLLERGFEPQEIKSLFTEPDYIRIQNNGARAFIKKIDNRYSIAAINPTTKKLVFAIKKTRLKKIINLGKNYGWTL